MAPRTGRPKLPDNERRLLLTVRVHPDTMRDVLGLAKVADISRGEVVDLAVELMAKRQRSRRG